MVFVKLDKTILLKMQMKSPSVYRGTFHFTDVYCLWKMIELLASTTVASAASAASADIAAATTATEDYN